MPIVSRTRRFASGSSADLRDLRGRRAPLVADRHARHRLAAVDRLLRDRLERRRRASGCRGRRRRRLHGSGSTPPAARLASILSWPIAIASTWPDACDRLRARSSPAPARRSNDSTGGLRRRQRRELPFDVDQAGHVAHRLAAGDVEHRQPVREHHREPAVVVAVGQLGVVDVDLAHVRRAAAGPRWHGKIFFTHRLGDGQVERPARRPGPAAEQRGAVGHALRDRRRGRQLGLALGDDDEREPRRAVRSTSPPPAGLRSHGSVRRFSTICGSRSPNAPSALAGGKLDRIWSVGIV